MRPLIGQRTNQVENPVNLRPIRWPATYMMQTNYSSWINQYIASSLHNIAL